MNEFRIEKAITSLICLILLVSTFFSFYQEDKENSSLENRTLVQYNEANVDNLLTGKWQENFDEYNKDQFVFRSKCIRAKYIILDALGIKERNGYVLSNDDMILETNDPFVSNADIEEANNYGINRIEAIKILTNAADTYGGKVIYLNVPDKEDLYYDNYPKSYNNNAIISKLSRDSIISKAKESNIKTVETYDILDKHKNEDLYFKGDHHWTLKGAYYAYQELLNTINESRDIKIEFPNWEELNISINTNERMTGSSLKVWGDSKLLLDEYMIYAYPYEEISYTRYDNGELTETPLFNRNGYAYGSYMGGNIGNTIIETNRESLPSILWIGYSYTNPLEILSTYNFNNVESIDPRYWQGSLSEYIKERKPDYVIILKDDIYKENTGLICTVE